MELPERCLQNDAAKQFTSLLIKTLETQSADQCGLACVHGMERILPLWHASLEAQNQHIQQLLVVRHPLDVVEQFKRTEGWDRDRALLVWLQSTLAMERYSRNLSRVVVDGEQLSWNLEITLNLVENTFQLTLPNRNHKTLIKLESESKSSPPVYYLGRATIEGQSAGSLLLTMALQLYDWLISEGGECKIQSHLPEIIRQQLNLAEALMGRTLNEISLQNQTLNNKLLNIENRRSVRFSNWLRRQTVGAA